MDAGTGQEQGSISIVGGEERRKGFELRASGLSQAGQRENMISRQTSSWVGAQSGNIFQHRPKICDTQDAFALSRKPGTAKPEHTHDAIASDPIPLLLRPPPDHSSFKEKRYVTRPAGDRCWSISKLVKRLFSESHQPCRRLHLETRCRNWNSRDCPVHSRSWSSAAAVPARAAIRVGAGWCGGAINRLGPIASSPLPPRDLG